MKVRHHIMILIALMVVSVQAGDNAIENFKFGLNPGDFYQKPEGFLSNLINPEKFSMSQSYSFSVASGGGRTFNNGLYLNTMEYKFSDPLVAKVSIGFMHQPFRGPQITQNNQGEVFVQRATLQYRPSRKMMLTIDFQQNPTPYFWRY